MRVVTKTKTYKSKNVRVDDIVTLNIEYSEREAKIYYNNKLLTHVSGDFEEVCFPHPVEKDKDICLEKKDIFEVSQT